jgi:ABC-2 type transport system permease protein
MRYLRLLACFVRASLQEALAYRANFWIQLMYVLLNLATGVLALAVLFGQVQAVRGWTLPATLALLGVYLTVGALRALFMGPSLDALAGMQGELWTGRFDFTLLRPVNTQFMASCRIWRPFALLDLLLGFTVLVVAVVQLGQALTVARLAAFLVALGAGMTILYAILLAVSALAFWSPGALYTWIFNDIFQMARYPVGLYPGWLRLLLTWVVPVGVITTVPAQALTGAVSGWMLAGSVALAGVLVLAASALFRLGLRRYASASS